jgi:glycosyltransferase involved in cell wall biosynthesis
LRILQLTPGTGGFFCGTCIRDNALTVALRKQGHDALMVPLYLPPALDEASGAEGAPLFYGGINVYLQQKSGLFRRTPRWVDRLFDSPGALKGAAKRAGMTQAHQLGDLTVSMLKGEDGHQAKELDRLAEWLASDDGRPDVVILSNALLMGLARRIKKETGALVVCTLQGEDTFLDSLPDPDREMAWQTLAERAADVDAFIAVSRYHADLMTARANLPPGRVHVVYNGILLDGYDAPRPPAPARCAARARLPCPHVPAQRPGNARRGVHRAARTNRIKNLQLRVAGAQTAGDEAFVARLRARLDACGLGGDAAFFPNVSRDEKIAFFARPVRVVGPGDLRRVVRAVRHRGAGGRRSGRPAAPRRFSRTARRDGRRRFVRTAR